MIWKKSLISAISIFVIALFIGASINSAVAVNGVDKGSTQSQGCPICAKSTKTISLEDSNGGGGCEDCIESMMNAIDIGKDSLRQGFSKISKRIKELGMVYPGVTGDIISVIYQSVLRGLISVEFKEPANLFEMILANMDEFMNYPLSNLGKLFAAGGAVFNSILEWLLSFCFESNNDYTQSCYSSEKQSKAMASSRAATTDLAPVVTPTQNSKTQVSAITKQTSTVSSSSVTKTIQKSSTVITTAPKTISQKQSTVKSSIVQKSAVQSRTQSNMPSVQSSTSISIISKSLTQLQ